MDTHLKTQARYNTPKDTPTKLSNSSVQRLPWTTQERYSLGLSDESTDEDGRLLRHLGRRRQLEVQATVARVEATLAQVELAIYAVESVPGGGAAIYGFAEHEDLLGFLRVRVAGE